MNYHREVSKLLTEVVRNGGTIGTDAKGIKVYGSPDDGLSFNSQELTANGGYQTVYRIWKHDGTLLKEMQDEYGRFIECMRLGPTGIWHQHLID